MVNIELRKDRSESIDYDYPDYPIYIRRNILSTYPDYAAPSHWHDDLELIAVLSGRMDYNVNGEIISLSQGEGIVVNSRQLHFGFSAKHEECDFICLLLHPQLLGATVSYERDFILPVINCAAMPYIKLSGGWTEEIYRGICRIYEMRGQKSAPLKVQSVFIDIWAAVYEHLPDAGGEVMQDSQLAAVKNMIGYIRENYADKVTLAEIAASGAVGQSKCCALFRKYLGQTPNSYLTRCRLDKGSELLRRTELSVTEIAAATGFGGGSYFAEVFAKWYGTSPGKYRAEMRKSGR